MFLMRCDRNSGDVQGVRGMNNYQNKLEQEDREKKGRKNTLLEFMQAFATAKGSPFFPVKCLSVSIACLEADARR